MDGENGLVGEIPPGDGNNGALIGFIAGLWGLEGFDGDTGLVQSKKLLVGDPGPSRMVFVGAGASGLLLSTLGAAEGGACWKILLVLVPTIGDNGLVGGPPVGDTSWLLVG